MPRLCSSPTAAPACEKHHPIGGDSLTEVAAGPGWYESTWELASGLEVTEVLHAEAPRSSRAAAIGTVSARA